MNYLDAANDLEASTWLQQAQRGANQEFLQIPDDNHPSSGEIASRLGAAQALAAKKLLGQSDQFVQ